MSAATRMALAAALAAAACAACQREKRVTRSAPPSATPERVQMSLEPGPPTVDSTWTVYEGNRWAVSEGSRLFSQYNCAGCHASAGGGGMGPALRDSLWIYGGEPENVFATIVEGRPNGMPSFKDKIATDDVWKLVAFVKSLSSSTPPDTWSARQDHMAAANPRREAPGRYPAGPQGPR